MNDADIHAFGPAPAPARQAPRRIWPWVLGGLAALALLMLAGCVALVFGLANAAHEHVHVVVNGQDWRPGAAALLGGGVALLVALLVVVTVVPMAVLLALGCAVFAVGAALLPVVGMLALLLSPVWLLLLVLWLAFRPRKPAPGAATMNP